MNRFFSRAGVALALGCAGPALAIGFGFGGQSDAKVGKPVAFDPAADHAGEAGQLVWINKAGGAKGVKKVVIPFFQVQFVTSSHADATLTEGASSGITMNLDGPSAAQEQTIVDGLYHKLVADLAAADVEVVTADAAAAASPAWREMLAQMKPSGTAVDGMNGVKSAFVSPAGMGFYLLPSTIPDYSGGGRFEVMGNIGMVKREQTLITESGAAVLGFRAVVDFASLKSSDKGAFGHHGSFAWTKGQAQVAIRPIATQMFLLTPAAKGTMMDPSYRMRFELAAPLLVDTDAIRAIDDTTTSGAKIGNAMASVFNAMHGAGGVSSKTLVVRVDPTTWERDVAGALGGVETMMVTRLKGEL